MKLFSPIYGGIFYTVNGGTNIYQRNEGYNVGQFYSVALHPKLQTNMF
ncbi:MAG: hypothetical protein CM15mP23_23110 [Cryomorphaceae bacterium]|nr:MAG: hypothetical protein CM15mP23_23110 [Cryomorphaceae bacterium]